MTNLTTKLNKLVLDDSPSEKLINACAEIDIESCFDLICLLYTSPSPRDISGSRMPSSA